MTAEFSLPPGHPFTNVRPGYSGYESAPSPTIVSATASYIGAVGDYANSTITFQGFSTTPGDWTVTTPSGLTIVTSPTPNNQPSTTIVYTGGQRDMSYTFYTIRQLPTIGTTTISWGGIPPSVTLTSPKFGTTIASGYYDGNAIYLTPVTVTPLTPLVQGITDYFFVCTNSAAYTSVDSVGMATIPYPIGNAFVPGTSTTLNFTVACRFIGILGPASSPAFPITVIQPAVPLVTITPPGSTTTSITLSWTQPTPNCTFTISAAGGTTLTPTTNPFTITSVSPGTYSFQVGATLCGLTTYSARATTTVAPTPPSSFTGTDNLNNSVTLAWSGQTAGSQMNLTWNGAATGSSNNIGNSPFNLSIGCGTYSFTLVSLCGGVTSGSVSVNNVNVTPSTPTNFQQSVFGSTATLSWSEATPGCQFTLTSSPAIGVTPVVTGNTAVYSGIAAGTYTITLQSLSAGLNSVSSVSTQIVVSLAAPTNFSARSLGSKITLNWTGTTAGATFSLSCTNNSAFGTQTIPAGVFTASYGNVSTPGIYTFSVVSVLPGNNVSAPATVSGQIVSTPADFKAVSTGSTINLNWTQVTTGSTFSLSSSPSVPNLSITGNTATSTGATPGKYTFNLSAFTSGGSFLSTTVSTTTQVISTPNAFSASFVAPNVILTWSSATANCTFTLLSSPSLTNPAPTTALTAEYSAPLPGNYTFSVTAADGFGNTSSPASTTQTVTPPSPSNLAYTPVSPTAFTITFSEALANCTFGFTNGPTVGSVAVTGTAGSYSAAFTGLTPAGIQAYTITVNSSFGGILSTGNSSILARTKPNTTFSSNALCTVVGGFNTVSAQYIINNPDGAALYGPYPFTPVGTSYTVKMLYSGTTTTPGVSASSPDLAGSYETGWWGGGYAIVVPSAFPDFIVPPTIGTVTVSGTTITVPWTDSTTGSLTYAILGTTLSASGIAAGTQTKVFTGATVGTAYSFTITTGSGYVTANSATSTAVTPIAAPTNLSAAATGTTVNMSWSYGSLTGITFNVFDQNGTTRGTTGLTTTSTSFTVSDSTAYTFTVQAIAQGGNVRATSGGISVTTVPAPSITSVIETGSTLTITCGTPASGTLSVAQTLGTSLTVGNTTNPFTYTGAAANTSYGFTVTNTGTKSINTASSNITTMGQPTFTKSDASGQSVILQWSYPTGAPTVTSYSVFPSGSTSAVVTGLTTLSYTFIPSGVTPPLVYNVVAIGAVGTGIASANTDNITPLTSATIGNPGATSTDGTNVTVTWTYPTTSTAGVTFKIYDPTLATLYSTYSYSAVSSTYNNTFSTSLTKNSTYSFVVMTTNPQGDTAVSGVTCNVTLLTAPVVKTINQTGGQILVTLSAQPTITPAPYTPYYTIPGISPTGLTLTTSTTTTFTYSGATSATAYTFTIQNNAGTGAPNSTNTTTQLFTALSTPVAGSIAYIPGTTSVSASWTYGGTVAGTQFILKNSDGSQFGTVTGVTSANISATIGTTYTLTVTASSGGNVSFPSSAFSAVTAVIPFTISSFVQNGTRLIATVSGSASSASTVPSLGFPSVFPGTPMLWLDAADPNATGIPAVNGATISTWKDKSGLGCNATATGTPTIISTGLNGQPTMDFNGSSWFAGLTANTSATMTTFIVLQHPVVTAASYIRFLSMAPATAQDQDVGGLVAEITGGQTIVVANGNAGADFPQPNNTPYIMDFQANGTNLTAYLNGTAYVGNPSTTNFNITRYRIGAMVTNNTNVYTGKISEVIVFREALTTDQRKTIEYYLGQKWGLAGVPSGFTGSPLTFTFNGASANTNYTVNVVGSGSTVSTALTTLFTPGAPTLTAPAGTSVYASTTYNGATNPPGITLNYFNSVGNANVGSSFVGTAGQSYTVYATATSGLNTSISSGNSAPIIPIGPITYTKVPTTGGGVAITCAATGATSFSGTSPGLSSTVIGNVVTFANAPLSGLYYIITIVATNATGATNSITITEKTSFAPASTPGLSMWYDAADITTIGYRAITTPVVSNLQFWLDGKDAANLSAPGGNLTKINDKSGNNYTSTAASMVDYSSATGLLRFHNGQYLNLPQGSINAAPKWAMFMVIKPVNLTDSWILGKQHNSANSTNMFGIGQYANWSGYPANTTTAGTFTYHATDFVYPDHLEAAVLTTSLQVLSMVYDGTNFNFYVNGSLRNTITTGSWPILSKTDANSFTLGSWYIYDTNYGGNTDFYLGELQFYNTNLTDTNRQLVEGYLAWKWGLQGSLPTAHTYSTTKVTVGPAFTSTYSTTEVASWRDKSDNALDLTWDRVEAYRTSSGGGNGIPTVYPTYSPTFLGGLYPGVNFSNGYNSPQQGQTVVGVCALMSRTFSPSPVLSANRADTTIFLVYYNPVTNSPFGGVFGLGPTSEFDNGQFSLISPFKDGSTSDYAYFGFGGDRIENLFRKFTTSVTPGPQIYTITKLGSNITWYNYGTQQLTTVDTDTISTSLTSWFALGICPGTIGLTGYVSELMVYNYALNTTQRQQIEGYLGWKWGLQNALSLNNPYNGPGGVKPPSYIGPLSSGPIEWIDGADVNTMTLYQVSPSDLLLPYNIPQMAMWFDAYDSNQVTLEPGTSNVTGWKDKSGNGRDTTIVGSGTAPTYSPNGFVVNGQGYPGIKFNKGQFLATQSFPTSLGSVLSSNSTDTTAFVVFNDLNTSAMNNALCGTNTGIDGYYGIRRNVNGINRNYFMFGGSYVIDNFNYVTSISQQLYTFMKTPTSVSFYAYGNLQTTANTTTTLSAGAGKRFNIGMNESPATEVYNSYISEVIIYNYALNTTQRQQIEGYLAWKWGLEGRLPLSGHLGSVTPPQLYTGPLSSGPIMWYDAADITTMTLEISDVSGLVLPSTIPGLSMWFDAYDDITITTTDGTTVTGWKDKSGNGRDTTIVGSGAAPTYLSNGFVVNGQGYPGIKFNNGQFLATQSFTNPSLGSVLSSNSTDTTAFVVFNDLNTSGMDNALCGTNTGIDGYYGIRRNANGINRNYFMFGGSYVIDNFNYVPSIQPQLYTFAKTPTSASFYAYGNLQVTSNTTTTLGTGAGKRFNIGMNESPATAVYNSYISEVIIYNRALSTAERQQVEGYLAQTWGMVGQLPADHPGRTTLPFLFRGPVSVGPIAWYDAADALTIITNTSQVQKWNDKSGRGYNLSLGGGTITYSNYGPGPAINLSGGFMFSTSLANLQNYALFTVLGSQRAVYNQAVITGRSSNTASYNSTDGFGLYVDSSGTPQLRLYGNSGGSNINTVSGTGTSTTPPTVVNNISQYITATPGTYTVTSDASYTYYKFTQNSTLTISSAAAGVPVYYFAVGGGGGGGGTPAGGGGGAGGLQTNISQSGLFVPPLATQFVPGGALTLTSANPYAITIGTGGASATSGSATTFSAPGTTAISAAGGGAGASSVAPASTTAPGSDGGSGGGASGGNLGPGVYGGIGNQGYNGGFTAPQPSLVGGSYPSGGGGGIGGPGSDVTQPWIGGNGGPAVSFLNLTLGGGGGGSGTVSVYYYGSAGSGGGGGAGNGGSSSSGGSASPNTGSGGGGSGRIGTGAGNVGGNGGSGVFILVVPNSGTIALRTDALSPVIASYTGAANGVISSWINGNNGTITTTGQNRTISGQGFAIGAEWTGSAYTNFTSVTSLYEIVVMSNVPTTVQRQQMEGYLAWKWGLQANLPASHPYKTYTPIGPIPSYTTTNVINVADKSGYGNFLTSNSISYPTYDASAKGISFGPNAALSNRLVKIPAGYSMFAIASLTSSPTNYGRLVNIGTTDFYGYMGTFSTTSQFATFTGNGNSWNDVNANTPVSNVSTYPALTLLEMDARGNVLTPFINGTTMTTKSSANQPASVTGINFGLLPSTTGQIWPGYLHEFMLVSQLLTSGQRQQIEGYLAWKWNISSQLPAGHPYRLASSVQPHVPTNRITALADKSGLGNNFTPVSFPNYPTYSSTYTGIYFGISASFVNASLAIPAGYTMMAVASLSTTPVSYGRLINVGPGDVVGFLGTYEGTSNFATFTGNGTTWNDITANVPATPVSTNPSLPSIMEMTVCGTVLTPYFNGADMSAKVGTTISATGIIIGAKANNGGQFWTGYLNEFLLFPQNLTILQRQQLEGYLAWKWGLQGNLPSTHPFKLGPP